jgi:enoyl-CoA hydratase
LAPDESVVLTERRGPILLVTLNRPHVRNCFDAALAHGLAGAVDELDRDDGVSAGVITGAGPGFSAGLDLTAFARGDSAFLEGRGFAGIVTAPPSKPLIAAVEGFAVGGGLEVALACDLIVAADDALLGLPEVRRGLIAVGGGLLRLPRWIPRNVAMEMALTGAPITAQRGYELGLVNRVAEPGRAVDSALDLAALIVRNSRPAVMASKQIAVASASWGEGEQWRRQDDVARPVLESEGVVEDAAAVAARLEVVWKAAHAQSNREDEE